MSDAESGGTRVRLDHSGWSGLADGAREQHAQGWEMFLGNLRTVLEDGQDIRAEAAGMRVMA